MVYHCYDSSDDETVDNEVGVESRAEHCNLYAFRDQLSTDEDSDDESDAIKSESESDEDEIGVSKLDANTI